MKHGMCNKQFSDANPELNCIIKGEKFECPTIHPGQTLNVWEK